MAQVRIGISGWRYPPWRGVFYPRDLPQRLELWYAARIFSAIELNGSFYSLRQPVATPGSLSRRSGGAPTCRWRSLR